MNPSIPNAAAAWMRDGPAMRKQDTLVCGEPHGVARTAPARLAHVTGLSRGIRPAAPEIRHDAEYRPASPVGHTSLSPTTPAPDATNCAEGAGGFLGGQG